MSLFDKVFRVALNITALILDDFLFPEPRPAPTEHQQQLRLQRHELVTTAEQEHMDDDDWTLEQDRALCLLWLFTSLPISVMAELLFWNGDVDPRPSHCQLKRRIILLQSSSYARSFVYHELKNMKDMKGNAAKSLVGSFEKEIKLTWDLMRGKLLRADKKADDDDSEEWGDSTESRWSAKVKQVLRRVEVVEFDPKLGRERPEAIDESFDSDDEFGFERIVLKKT